MAHSTTSLSVRDIIVWMSIRAVTHPEDEPQHLIVVKRYTRRNLVGQFFRSSLVAEVDDVANLDDEQHELERNVRPIRKPPKQGGFKFKQGS